jgi:hypothetical protein
MHGNAETERLKAIAHQTRLKTIATELTLAFTWCSVARTEAEMGEEHRFRISIQRIKSAADSLRRRIADPTNAPTNIADFDSELEKLEAKIRDLESRGVNPAASGIFHPRR